MKTKKCVLLDYDELQECVNELFNELPKGYSVKIDFDMGRVMFDLKVLKGSIWNFANGDDYEKCGFAGNNDVYEKIKYKLKAKYGFEELRILTTDTDQIFDDDEKYWIMLLGK